MFLFFCKVTPFYRHFGIHPARTIDLDSFAFVTDEIFLIGNRVEAEYDVLIIDYAYKGHNEKLGIRYSHGDERLQKDILYLKNIMKQMSQENRKVKSFKKINNNENKD
jgi:hypothetical protein